MILKSLGQGLEKIPEKKRQRGPGQGLVLKKKRIKKKKRKAKIFLAPSQGLSQKALIKMEMKS